MGARVPGEPPHPPEGLALSRGSAHAVKQQPPVQQKIGKSMSMPNRGGNQEQDLGRRGWAGAEVETGLFCSFVTRPKSTPFQSDSNLGDYSSTAF